MFRWLRKGKNIRKAIEKANRKYPGEALEINDTNSDDVVEYYDYIMWCQKIMNKPNIIFQFKVTLKDINPEIWRRIQVPSKYSFWDLHVAIQDSMGWFDYHLHAFRIKRPHGRKMLEIGIPTDDFDDIEILPGWDENIVNYFVEPGKKAEYEYDFGDSWHHDILFEGILLREKNTRYPVCLAGKRACPPEDCGGVWGYEKLLEILRDPKNEEYESMVKWLRSWYGKYDPERFDNKKIKFDNPEKRWNNAFLKH